MSITYFCVGFLPLLIFSSSIFKTVDNYFTNERKRELMRQANVIAGQIETSEYLTNESKEYFFDRYIVENSRQGEYRIIVTDATGTVVGDSNGTDVDKTLLVPEVIEALGNKSVARVQENGSIYVAVSIVNPQTSEMLGTVLISASSADISLIIEDIKSKVTVLMTGIVIVVGIIVLFLSQAFVRPLKDMLQSIRRMTDGHLDSRASVSSWFRNEFSDVSYAFNTLAEKLEQLDITRQNFVSNVSHELKTPLSSMKVLSESVLLEKDLPKDLYVEFLQDINSEVDRMSNIISDLLNLVKLDQRVVPLSFENSSLNDMLSVLVKRLKPLANQKKTEITLETSKEVNADIDRVKLELAISNLIENAIKYTEEGGLVRVSLDCDHQNAFIKVSDTGVGIPEEEQGKIFDRFYRVDKMRDRETGGTGLGLSITHSTVLIHNGSIKVVSKENEGSTFLVRIPLRQS